MNKNRFAGAVANDSDDDVKQVTKTQKKKEERKITEKAPPKIRAPDQKNREAEGFTVNQTQQARP